MDYKHDETDCRKTEPTANNYQGRRREDKAFKACDGKGKVHVNNCGGNRFKELGL
jgi:hypothetical protein